MATPYLWVRGPSGPLQETPPARSAVHTPRPTAAAVDEGAGLRPARDLAAFGGSGPEGPRTQRTAAVSLRGPAGVRGLPLRRSQRHHRACCTEAPHGNAVSLGARAFWPASGNTAGAQRRPYSEADRCRRTKEPAYGRRVTWPPSAAAGQKARAPRERPPTCCNALLQLQGHGAPDPLAATRPRLLYRSTPWQRRISGCAGLLARFRKLRRRAAPSILRGRPLPPDEGAGLRPARDLAAFGGSGPEGPRTQRTAAYLLKRSTAIARSPGLGPSRSDARPLAVQKHPMATPYLWVRGPSGPLQETPSAHSAVHTPRPRSGEHEPSSAMSNAAPSPADYPRRRWTTRGIPAKSATTASTANPPPSANSTTPSSCPFPISTRSR